MSWRSATGPVVSAPAVALAIADFLANTERERQWLFQAHLRSTVIEVSPLLLELAALEQIDLTAATALMAPPQHWPWRLSGDTPNLSKQLWLSHRLLLGATTEVSSGRFRRAFTNPGVIVRGINHPRGRFGIRPNCGTLAFVADLGPCRLSVFSSIALIKLPEPLPETLTIAMSGRRLGDLIDHPLFRERECIVGHVLTDSYDGSPVLTFRVPLVPFELTWPGDDL